MVLMAPPVVAAAEAVRAAAEPAGRLIAALPARAPVRSTLGRRAGWRTPTHLALRALRGF